MNVVENLVYLVYLGLWWRYKDGDGSVRGRVGAGMLVLLFGGAVMTTGKTVLYCEFVSSGVVFWRGKEARFGRC
jgi:hypothetical protein